MQFEQGANPSRVKAGNQAAILKTIYLCGPIKRSEVARRLGLTLPTITTNINSMMARGIVRETGSERSITHFAGRKAHLVDIVPESRHFAGVEIQGMRRTVCLLDYRGKVLYQKEHTGEEREYGKNIALTCGMVDRALSACGLRPEDIAGIGVCLPGLVDTQQGVLEVRPSYSWTHKNIRADMASRMNYPGPIYVENNACARAYGAQLFRREDLGDAQTFAYLFLNQGIACPLVLNTAIDFGSVVGAGEVGHMVMVPNGEPCSCGNRGCLEAYASDTAVLRSCAQAIERGEAPVLRRLRGEGPLSMEQVLAAQEAGEEAVARIVGQAVHILGVAVANINNFACPSLMLIEGRLFSRPENWEHLLEVVRLNLCGVIRRGTRFLFVEPDPFSGAAGAAAMAICKDLETYIEF
ncbi:MAG: ROK family transcriptional regulator [Oscillospiraceae bacterium]|nr:ROK family transcriptional regulator [Oscillospiraceae bacterium]MCI8720955.1 ROK family transcriptional regulator [Oscillospiraceae bacterium]